MKLQQPSRKFLSLSVSALLIMSLMALSAEAAFSFSSNLLAVGRKGPTSNLYVSTGAQDVEMLRLYFKPYQNMRVNMITFQITDTNGSIDNLALYDLNGNQISPEFVIPENGTAEFYLEYGLSERIATEAILIADLKPGISGNIRAILEDENGITARSAVTNEDIQIVGVTSTTFPIKGRIIIVQSKKN